MAMHKRTNHMHHHARVLRNYGMCTVRNTQRNAKMNARTKLHGSEQKTLRNVCVCAGGGGEKKSAGRDELSSAASRIAATFAPRSSEVGRAAKPAAKGSVLCTVFEIQAGISAVVGGLLAFNVIFPSDEPSIARLLGMWSCWILTVPSLRARECGTREKDALNLLFLLIPVINVGVPFVWKSFAAVYSADMLALIAVYAWKLDWIGVAMTPDQGTSDDDTSASASSDS